MRSTAHFHITTLITATLAALAAFTLASAAIAAETKHPANKKLKVIATLFPQYDFAAKIGRDKTEVKLLLPPGAESHSFEPTPADIRDIANADVFIHTGKHMEPWAERLANSSTAEHALIVDASQGIDIRNADTDNSEHNQHTGHEHPSGHDHSVDPHIWLDPIMAGVMVDNIGAALATRDTENVEFYLENTRELRAELERLNHDIAKRIAMSPRRLLVFGGRFAFSYFFTRYGLESASPYKSCTAGSEPGLRAVIDTITLIRHNNVKYIYVEEMTSGRIAETISKETGATVLHVDSLHNPPLDKQKNGAGYISIMRDNLAAFARGLE